MISVLPKAYYDTPKNSDLKIKANAPSLPINLIIDGEVVRENLKEAGFDEQWLKKELEKQKFHHYEDELFAEWMQKKMYCLQNGCKMSRFSWLSMSGRPNKQRDCSFVFIQEA